MDLGAAFEGGARNQLMYREVTRRIVVDVFGLDPDQGDGFLT
jgi:hypothetical protein